MEQEKTERILINHQWENQSYPGNLIKELRNRQWEDQWRQVIWRAEPCQNHRLLHQNTRIRKPGHNSRDQLKKVKDLHKPEKDLLRDLHKPVTDLLTDLQEIDHLTDRTATGLHIEETIINLKLKHRLLRNRLALISVLIKKKKKISLQSWKKEKQKNQIS